MFSRTELPRRPAIPLMFHALVALVISIRMVMREGEGLAAGKVASGTFAAAVLLACVALALKVRKSPFAGTCGALGLSVLMGVALASVTLAQEHAFVAAMQHAPVSSWSVRIVSDPTPRDDLFRCQAVMEQKGMPSGTVWLTLPQGVSVGSRVHGVGNFDPNEDNEWGTASRMQGISGSVKLSYVSSTDDPEGLFGALQNMRQGLLNALRPQESSARALLAGCVCGSRASLVSLGLDDAFARCGLAHLIAVSGSHLAIFSALGASILGFFRLRRGVRSVVLMAGCALFVAFCGAPASAIRAWIMVCSAHVAALAGRRAHALSGVSLAGIVLVVFDPTATGQAGYLLSVVAVSGLCLFSPYAAYALEVLRGARVPRRRPAWLPKRAQKALRHAGATCKETLCASLVAHVVTMPITWDTFGQISLVGPLASVLLSLPFTLFVGMGMLGCALGLVPLAQTALLSLCDVVGNAMLGVIGHMARWPYCSISVAALPSITPYGAFALALLLLLFWPRLKRGVVMGVCGAALLCVLILLARWRFFAPARVCVLDVGQGDAIVVQEGAATVLVDTGPKDAVVDALARNHIAHLDAIVITHLHDDHYGGLLSLAGHVSCDRVFFAQGVAKHASQEILDACVALTGQAAEELAYGDVVHAQGFNLRMVWPHEDVDGNDNADSMQLLLSYHEQGRSLMGLLTGDAECHELAALIQAGDVGDIDVLKVGHHGSEVSLTVDQARMLDPEVAIASAGKNNRYGHPAPACQSALEQAGSLFVCTKDVGDVAVSPGIEGPEVSFVPH